MVSCGWFFVHKVLSALCGLVLICASAYPIENCESCKEGESWREGRRCGVNVAYVWLRMHGVNDVSYSTVLDALHSGDRGASLDDLQNLLTEYGASVRAVKASPSDLERYALPCIAHCELETTNSDGIMQGHYVILLSLDRNRCTYVDGTTGRIDEMRSDRFIRSWSGYLLVKNGKDSINSLFTIVAGIGIVLGVIVVRRKRRSPLEEGVTIDE